MNTIEAKRSFFELLEPKYGQSECTAMWKYMSLYLLKHDIETDEYQSLLKKLEDDYPIQYAVNESYFYDLILFVDENVLVPRPETEELVHWIIQDIKGQDNPRIIDIGTGSGCIICTLGNHLSTADLYANEVSEGALNVAKLNAEKYNLDIEFIHEDILTHGLDQQGVFNVIVSNPPYIALTEQAQMSSSTIKYEPDIALYGLPSDSLVFYKRIATIGLNRLADDGAIYVELNALQSEAIADIFTSRQYQIEIRKDMQGLDRMLKATL